MKNRLFKTDPSKIDYGGGRKPRKLLMNSVWNIISRFSWT